jgi:transposase
MLRITEPEKVYLAKGVTDLRKSIDGLSILVKEGFKLDPFSTNLFVFCNRKHERIKILHWENNGFWLYYRRLESGKFNWPSSDNKEMISIQYREFRWLLDGLSIKQKRAHKEVKARTIL